MEMPLVNIMDLIPKDGLATADGIAELLYNISAKQQAADLALLRAERLKEAEWLEKWLTDGSVFEVPVMKKGKQQLIRSYIASLKGDGE